MGCRSWRWSLLDRYYWESVVGGPGAFVLAAESYETFAEAVLKKLVIEIAAAPASSSAVAARREALQSPTPSRSRAAARHNHSTLAGALA